MTLLDDIKRDREAGTPGPWLVSDEWNVTGLEYEVVAGSASVSSDKESEANARRIAHVPDMEAALLAAEGCANWCDVLIEVIQSTSCDPDDPDGFEKVLNGAAMFLAAYRAATGAA